MSTCSVTKLCPALCNHMDCSPPGSSVHGIFQARILGWVAISFSMGSSQTRNQICVSCIGRQFLYLWASWEAQAVSNVFQKKHQAPKYSLPKFTSFKWYASEVWESLNLGYVSSNIMSVPSCHNFHYHFNFYSVQFSCSVVSDSLQPQDCSAPGFPVHHQLPELAQACVHRVGDAIQPSHPLASLSPPAFSLS